MAKLSLCCTLIPLLGWVAIAFGQPSDPAMLRQDEAIALDHIAFTADTTCMTGNVSVWVDRIAFLNAGGTELAAVDVGTQADSYYLGQGWNFREGNASQNGRWVLRTASAFLGIPAGAASLRIRALGSCVAVAMQVSVNGTAVGSFNAGANAAAANYTLNLPQNLSQRVTYTPKSGGPVSIASLQWLSAAGAVLATSNTAVTVDDSAQSANVTRPAGASSFCVNFASAPGAASLLVTINSAAATLLEVPAGATRTCATESNVLERLADRKTLTNGWGEDFNTRQSFATGGFSAITESGDTVRAQHPGTGIGQLVLDLPALFPLTESPYLAVRIKADKGAMYFIRPNGLNAQNQPVALWSETAVTDDRQGKGEWETLTINLQKLVAQAGTNADRISTVSLVMTSLDAQPHVLEVDWVRLHRGLKPVGSLPLTETNFSNNIDDDGDGLTDRDDPDRSTAGRMALFGTDHPVTLAFYHVWYGTPNTASKSWQAWTGPAPGNVFHNPENFVANSPGQRDLWSLYYPLNTRDFPDYVPASPLRYDIHGGVQYYDTLEPDFLDHQIRLAQQFGIEGFLPDLGHQSNLRPPTEALVKAVGRAPAPFSVAPLYDFFYSIASVSVPEAPNYAKAREIAYFLELAKSPRWTQFLGKPLVTAAFASTLVSAANWTQTIALATDPRASNLDGVFDASTVLKGAQNEIRFSYAANGATPMRFERIVFRDANLKEISRTNFGTAETRALLDSGWGADSTSPLAAGTFATGSTATMRLIIPTGAEYMDIHATAVGSTLNTLAVSINGGPVADFEATQLGNVGYLRFSNPSVPVANPSQRPFSFLLDNAAVTDVADGFATYSEYTTGSGGVLVSEDKPLILSVRPGYDDRKIRTPGLHTPRENGMYYRRSWEAALAADPDAVLITSWNEWPEATNIEPTVEFGYQYAELTLTYSMMLRGELTLSRKASEIDFTVRRRTTNQIRLSSNGQGQAVLRKLSARKLGSYTVTFNGQPFNNHSADANAGTLTLNLGAAAGEYIVTFALSGPQISTVTSAASGHEGTLAPGEFFTIKGTGLGPENYSLGFDKGLGGARVFANGIELFITYSQANQLNVVLSNLLPTSGEIAVEVEYGGVRSEPVKVALGSAAPGIFTQQYGPGQAWFFHGDFSANGPQNAIERGGQGFFYATGAGAHNPLLIDGEQPTTVYPVITGDLQVLLNGKPIPQDHIIFKNLVFAAVLQINIKIPSDAPVGDKVELKIVINGQESRDGVFLSVK